MNKRSFDKARNTMKHNHKHMLDMARAAMPSDDFIFELSDIFKLFGDTTRLKILVALQGGELCVREITELLGMTQSAISHQLKNLKAAGLLGCRREGKTVLYSLADGHVRAIISAGAEHISE